MDEQFIEHECLDEHTWNNNAHESRLQRVAVDKRLRHELVRDIDVLNLFRSNILACDGITIKYFMTFLRRSVPCESLKMLSRDSRKLRVTHQRETQIRSRLLLFAVDNLETALGVPHANIATVDPSVTVYGLRRLVWHLVVLLEAVGAAEADFTARKRRILAGIVHLGNIDKLAFAAGKRRTHISQACIAEHGLK